MTFLTNILIFLLSTVGVVAPTVAQVTADTACWTRVAGPGQLVAADVPYQRGLKAQKLDIYLPGPAAQKQPYKTIVFIHGGCFTFGSKENPQESLPLIQRLTGSGYAVVSVEYRRADPGNGSSRKRNPYPAALEDVQDAVNWVRSPSGGGRFSLDPNRVAAFGYSAGGTLAAYLATRDIAGTKNVALSKSEIPVNTRRIPAVDLFGRMDFTLGAQSKKRDGSEGDCAEQFLGKNRAPENMGEFKAASVVPDERAANILSIHGTKDVAVLPVCEIRTKAPDQIGSIPPGHFGSMAPG